MGDRAFHPPAQRLVRLAKLLKLRIIGRGYPGAAGRTFDPGKGLLDPADGKNCAFIWHPGEE